jgi:hypothetical protein
MKNSCICFLLFSFTITKAQFSDSTTLSIYQKNAPLVFKFDKFSLVNQSSSENSFTKPTTTNFTHDPYLCYYMPRSASPYGSANSKYDVAGAIINGTLNTIYHRADKKVKEKSKIKR